jgi:hypothetical protein
MARATRIVQRLQLRAGSESAVRRVLPALEDGFRTATLPDLGARLVFVRRLQLGQLAANPSAQTVSLLIEKRFAEEHWAIVHAVERGADDAPAVWFRDALEAHEAAALKIASGEALDDWFWPLAIPAIAAAASDERLRALALAVGSMEEAPAALPAWTASLVRAGYRSRLIAALRPGDGRALLRSAGMSAVSTPVRSEQALTPGDAHGGRAEQVPTAPAESPRVSSRGQRNAELDDRVLFVELMTSRASGRPPQWPAAIAPPSKATADNAPGAVVPAPDVAARALREYGAPAPVARRETIEPGIEPASQRLVQAAVAAAGTGRGEAAEAPPGERLPRSSPDSHDVPRAANSAASDQTAGDAPHTFASPWQLPDAAPTAAGGLLFLLSVLERVGFAKWLAERGTGEPEPEVLAAQIFHRLLSRLRVDDDDPAWKLALPAIDVTGRAGLKPRPHETTLDELWLTSCRRSLRRHARIGLASLVLRPARLAITPTHVDVFFRLNAADVRIRRAGFDIDPGWVPWFARVVAFHYEERPWN